MSATCPRCGHTGAAADVFCGGCGAPLPGAVSGVDYTGSITSVIASGPATGSGAMGTVGSGIHYELPTGTALLVVHRGPGEGTEYILDAAKGPQTVGRSPEADIFLDDVTVSRHHAEFRHGAEGWSVRDVGSLNGTYVNRVRAEDQHLQGGDEVQIGKFRFVFLVGVDPVS